MWVRLTTEWRLKLGLGLLLNAVFWSGYQLLSRHAYFPLREIPLTVLDRAITFQPIFWGWIYLSQFVLTGMVPLLLTQREDLWRYVRTVGIMSSLSGVVFVVFPTSAPARDAAIQTIPMRFLSVADGPLNAMPSLHAAFVVAMILLSRRVFGSRTLVALGLWGVAILFSTLATKQHYALDLLAGGVLGWLADRVAWRGESEAAMMPVSMEVASHRGER